MTDDQIQTLETYRGVGIEADQPRERIDFVVKPAIDAVVAEGDAHRLANIAADVSWPPEARLLAAAKIEAIFEMAAESRETRPKLDLTYVRACVAGLGSITWRSPWHYASLLDHPSPSGEPGAVPREKPLKD